MRTRWCARIIAITCVSAMIGCSPTTHRQKADRVAQAIIANKQQEALGRTEPLTVERPSDTLRRRLIETYGLATTGPASLGADALDKPKHWPEDHPPLLDPDPIALSPWSADQPLVLSLIQALQVGARNSRDYQTQKEAVFLAALNLDISAQQFRTTFTGVIDGLISTDLAGADVTGAEGGVRGGMQRRFTSGAAITSAIAFDLAQLLTQDRGSSLGVLGDATVTIPLMRGSGRHITREPLTQAERNVLYALWEFEQFKRAFVVRVASDYLRVLQRADEVKNAEQNYRGVIMSSRRARRLADGGTLPPIQVDQALQDELRARDRWIGALQSLATAQDNFNVMLGLPPDAHVALNPQELVALTQNERARAAMEASTSPVGEVPPADAPITLEPPSGEDAGPLELPERQVTEIALENRDDMKAVLGRVYDSQRNVVIAADALRAEVTLLGSARIGERRSIGTAGLEDADFRADEGFYRALLTIDLPIERTVERNRYRAAWVTLEAALRRVQALEDQIKQDIRANLRDLLQARESIKTQARAVMVADRRVQGANLSLQAGRVAIRDVLEAQESLLSAQNAFTSAVVAYRVAELELQRDMGVLSVNHDGLWQEWRPATAAAP